MVGAVLETTERREWEERQKVLIAELQHRTFNLMGMVSSTADATMRSSADRFSTPPTAKPSRTRTGVRTKASEALCCQRKAGTCVNRLSVREWLTRQRVLDASRTPGLRRRRLRRFGGA